MLARTSEMVRRVGVRRVGVGRDAAAGVAVAVVMLLAAPGALAGGTGYAPVAGSPFPVRGVSSVEFSPNGRLLAVTTFNTRNAFARSTTVRSSIDAVSGDGRLTPLPGVLSSAHGGPDGFGEFSPDGRLIVGVVKGGLQLYRVGGHGVTGRVATWRIPVRDGSLLEVEFTPDGHALEADVEVASDDNLTVRYRLYSLAVGRRGALRNLPGSPLLFGQARIVGFDVRSDGGRMAIADLSASTLTIHAVRPDGRVAAAALSTTPLPGQPTYVTYSPNGDLIAVNTERTGRLLMYRVDRGGVPRAVPGSPFATGLGEIQAGDRVTFTAFTPDGRQLVDVAWGAGSVPVFTVSPDGELRAAQRLAIGPSPAANADFLDEVDASFGPGGRLLAVADSVNSTVSMFARP